MRMTNLNKFFRDVGAASRPPEVRTAFRAAVKQVEKVVEQELVQRLTRFADGFEAARSAAPTQANAATDGQYVTSLYKDLLGRAPDLGGFNSHLAGLRNGMTREQVREVFLDSAEFKAKSAVAPAPFAPAQKTGVDQLKALIDADLKTAFGHGATEADYSYWLPKLQSPCDSGFVTSGQMTGVEYYHRRMLGWQAGGSDTALFGPFAGSPEASGPVPSAVDVVGPLR